MQLVRKPTKLRRQFRATEVIVRKVESLEMLKRKKAAIRIDGTLKLAATNFDANDIKFCINTMDPRNENDAYESYYEKGIKNVNKMYNP